MSRTALYRHFDSGGALLYVGVSLNAIRRLGQHKYGAAWHGQVARVDIEWHPSRPDAIYAEALAIATEGPLWNVVRPTVVGSKDARKSPYPWAENEVRCCGDALDRVLWQGTQWAVTEYGIEARDGRYPIDRRRLLDRRSGMYEWPEQMRGKVWVDMTDFQRAFAVACWIHHGVPIAQHRTERACV